MKVLLIVLGAFLLFAPQSSDAFLDLNVSLKFVLNINIKLIMKFKFILNQTLNIFQAQNRKEMEAIKQQMHRDFTIIEHQLENLAKQIDTGFANLDKDIKMNLLLDLISRQASHFDRFQIIVNTNADDKKLLEQLNKFIDEYKRENLEDRMVNVIDAESPGTSSLIEALIKAVKKQADSDSITIKTSPNRLIYDFYMTVLYNVYRGYYFMQSSVFIRDIIEKNLHMEDHEYFRSMAQLSVDKIIKSMKRTSTAFGDDKKYHLSYKQKSNGKYFRSYKFYMGISQAPKGFVITGARLQQHNRNIVYLQIQVGQLIDHGQINATSVHWQKPNIDIDINVLHVPLERFYLGYVSFNDSVLTGIQFRHYNGYITTVAYGCKIEDHNAGTLGTDEFMTFQTATSSYTSFSFALADAELGMKAPLSGLYFSLDGHRHITPQAVTYSANFFMKDIDIGAPVKRPMSAFATNEIRNLIHESKLGVWSYVIIGGSVGFVFTIIAIVVVVIIFRRRESNIRQSINYDRIYDNA